MGTNGGERAWGHAALTSLLRVLRYSALPLIVLVFYATAVTHFACTPDDVYTYLQYAKNLLAGDGCSFSGGEQTYGFTSPLWLFLITLGGLGGIDLWIVAKVLDLLAACISIVLFYRAAFEMMRDVVPALLSTIVFSSGVWLVKWAGSGTEASIAVTLALLTFLYALRNAYLPAIVTAALLTLVRSEGMLLGCCVVADMIYNSNDRKRAMPRGVRLTVVLVAIVLPWYLIAAGLFGSALPNAAMAESGSWFNGADMADAAKDVVLRLGFSDGIALLVLTISAIVLIRRLRRSSDPASVLVRIFLVRQNLIPAGMIIGIPLVYVLSGTNVVSRYLLLVTPFIALSSFTLCYNACSAGRLRLYTLPAVGVVATLILLQNQVAYWQYVKPGIDAFEVGMQTTFIPMGKWLKSYSGADEAVFAWDVGALGFYSDRRVIDGAARATPDLIPLVRSGRTPEQMMRDRVYSSYPDVGYVVHRSVVREEWAADNLQPVQTMPFHTPGVLGDRTDYVTLYRVIRK